MPRNLFTTNEIILCAYAALWDANDFGGTRKIAELTGRSLSSIGMKIQNMAAMFDAKNIARVSTVSPLTGTPPGQPARETHWTEIQPFLALSQEDFKTKCLQILA